MQVEREKALYQLNLEYMSNLEKNYKEIRKFKHDYQNILFTLSAFLENKEYEKLESYYYEQIQPTSDHLDEASMQLSELSQLENLEMKSLLYTKLSVVNAKGFEIKLEIKEKIKIDSKYILSIVRGMGILLDNAIEALEDLGSGALSVAIIKDEEAVIIVVQNNCLRSLPPLFQLEQEGFSTKGENRGLGLTNLKEIFQDLPIMLETENLGERFTQRIIILLEGDGDARGFHL